MSGGEVKFTSPDDSLVFDGTTDGAVFRFDLATPREVRSTAQRATVDGSEVTVMSYRDVQETVMLYIEDTVANILDKVRRLEKMLQEARRTQYDLHIEGPVYIEYKKDPSDTWYRSEITTGVVLPESGAIDMYLKQGKLVVEVQLMHKWYWERSTEMELSINNPAGAGTGGIEIYNANDAYLSARYNYVQVNNSSILGDMAVPVRIEMYNSYNDANRLGDVWVGMQHAGTPGSLTQVIEGEDFSGGPGSQQPGVADYTKYSNGFYYDAPWSGTGEVYIGQWDLDDTMLAAYGSNYFHIFGILGSTQTYTDLRLRMKLMVALTELWQSDQFYAPTGTKLIDFGALRLPPYRIIGTPYDLEFRLYAQRDTAGSHDLDIDFFLLLPISHWRLVDTRAYNCNYQTTLYVDEPEKAAYTKGWSPTPTGELHNYTLRGKPLHLVPLSKTTGSQRIVFLMKEDVEAAFFDPDRTATIRVYYRPRRMTL